MKSKNKDDLNSLKYYQLILSLWMMIDQVPGNQSIRAASIKNCIKNKRQSSTLHELWPMAISDCFCVYFSQICNV